VLGIPLKNLHNLRLGSKGCRQLFSAANIRRRTNQLTLSGKEPNMTNLYHRFLSQTGLVIGRSFCPLFAIAIIVGTVLWGPWVSMAIAVLALITALGFL
jgi:LytS/YehU family sensor histidine kinase